LSVTGIRDTALQKFYLFIFFATMDSLNKDVLLEILLILPGTAIMKVLRTCKRWHSLKAEILAKLGVVQCSYCRAPFEYHRDETRKASKRLCSTECIFRTRIATYDKRRYNVEFTLETHTLRGLVARRSQLVRRHRKTQDRTFSWWTPRDDPRYDGKLVITNQ
jgi:hypothetical protein